MPFVDIYNMNLILNISQHPHLGEKITWILRQGGVAIYIIDRTKKNYLFEKLINLENILDNDKSAKTQKFLKNW